MNEPLLAEFFNPEVVPARLRRFLIDPRSGCWNWTGPLNRAGYPTRVQYQLRGGSAYRVIYEMYYGPIEGDVHIHHRCDNRQCVNPAHLQALTRSEHRRTYNTLRPDTMRRLMALVPEVGHADAN